MEYLCANPMETIYFSLGVGFILILIFLRVEKAIIPIAKQHQMTRFELFIMFSTWQLRKFDVIEANISEFKKYFLFKALCLVGIPFFINSGFLVITACYQ
ncbi:hypothetical protein RI845_02095 [Thalassotalea nanhaiensis]|uniref:Uncharacterized protein n=1 Tax=Thalassotalea nanhaiensis TaxID=3065648 RepID=A0ABY9TJH3_9GAMM|nr:hypothetical protein RI845_02095 [Colwelliaceae bacterium SQ345]